MDKLNIDGVVGDPVNPYLQQYSDTCAIKSQQIILQEYGINVTEDELARMALENGWYNEGGTLPADVGNLIQAAGIPVSRVDGANIYDLAEQLSKLCSVLSLFVSCLLPVQTNLRISFTMSYTSHAKIHSNL